MIKLLILLYLFSHVYSDMIAFSFSGAGARIAQEAALAQALIEGLSPSGDKIIPSVITGASAGTLNAVAVNGILKSKANKDKLFTWDDYTNVLFSLKDGNVFDTSINGIYKIVAHNIESGYLLDTTPLRNTIQTLLTKMGLKYFGDLYLPTIISVVEKNTGYTLRLRSDDPRYSNLSLIEVMMASAAIPLAFSPQMINGLSNGYYIDGATGEDEIPIYGLFQNFTKPLDRIYVIARQFYFGPDVPNVLRPIKIVVNAIETLEYLRQSLYVSGLEEAKAIKSVPTYSYIPELPHQYGMFSFDQQKPQWEETMAWARLHNPTKIN